MAEPVRVLRRPEFRDWLLALKDHRAVDAINRRLDRIERGNPGDWKPVGDGVGELRIDFGPGYRLYFVRRGEEFIVTLCAGSKSTQSRDISTARQLAKATRLE